MATTQSKTQRTTTLQDETAPKIDGKAARRKVNAFLALHVGEMLRAADKSARWSNWAGGWGVPVCVVTPGGGFLEIVGSLFVTADVGEVTFGRVAFELMIEKARVALQRIDAV